MSTILLIEDNPDCAHMVKKLLTPLGYIVIHAANGATGLQLVRQMKRTQDLHLILLDINLPDISGNAIVFQIRRAIQLTTSVPIIAFTAEQSSVAKRIAMAHGCDGFLSKPIDMQAFPSQIANYLKLARHYS